MNIHYKLLLFILFLFTSNIAKSNVGDKLWLKVQGKNYWTFTVTSETPDMKRFPGTVSFGYPSSSGSYYLGPDWEGEVIIPSQVTDAATGYKYNVTGIADHAFDSSSSITSIILPEGIDKMGTYVFANCSSLISVDFPSTLKINNLKEGTFWGCTSLDVSAVLHHMSSNAVGFSCSIGKRAFCGCNNVTNLIIPANISVGEQAFQGCTALESVLIESNSIGMGAFQDCSNLERVYIDRSAQSFYFGITPFKGISPQAVLYVPYEYLSEYTEQAKYEFSKWFSNIEIYKKPDGTFKSILSPYEDAGEVVFQIKDTALLYAQIGKDGEIAIPNDYAGEFTVPDTITAYDRFLFRIKGIGDSAFRGTGINSIKISENLTYIKENAFTDCGNLASVFLPQSINSIATAFANNENLSSMHVSWRNPDDVEIAKENFNQLASNATLYVPAGTAERYAEHEVWRKFTHIVETSPISVGDVTARYGSRVSVPIYLKNEEQITGLQFRLTLPEDLTIADENGELIVSTTERTEGFTIAGRKDPDEANSYIFVIISFSGNVITGNEGAIMSVKIDVADNLALGKYDVNIEDIVIATSSFDEKKPENSYANLTVTDILLGDTSGDGKVNVTDVGMVIDHILEHTPTGFIESAADLNHDGHVNVTDVGLIIDIILSDNASAKKRSERNKVDMLDPQ